MDSMKRPHFKNLYNEGKVSSIETTDCITVNLCKMATQIDKTKILMTNGSLMKDKSIAECSA